jgi:hypothetical protein
LLHEIKHDVTVMPVQEHSWTEQRLIRMCGPLLALAALIVMYGPFLIRHARNSANPFIFADDARPWITPFFLSDFGSDYHRSLLPFGYRIFYQTIGLVVDPITISKVLPYFLLLTVVAGVWIAAGRFGGIAASFSAAALCLSTNTFLSPMVGGTPRCFAPPLVAAAAVALIFGRTVWLAAIVVISAALYPPMAVVTGVALGVEALALPARDREQTREWSLRGRIALLGATALGSAFLVAPKLIASDYGPRLTLSDIATYPEAGPGGRYGEGNHPPFDNLWTELRRTAHMTLRGAGQPWSSSLHVRGSRFHTVFLLAALGVGSLAALGLGGMAMRDSAARRLLILGAAAAAAHTVALLFAPHLYFPERYVSYPISVLIVIAFPVAVTALLTLCRRVAVIPWTIGVTAAWLLVFGGRGDELAGLSMNYEQDSKIFEFLHGLPDSTLVAGWPAEDGIMDSVPYLARRKAFLTYETHQAFHREYLDEMRIRMHCLIGAIFAIDPAPLVHLRDDWGVTHLIVDQQYYGPTPPTYFKPFDAWINVAVERGRIRGFEVPRQIEAATVFSRGSLAVLDLRKLSVPRSHSEGPGHDDP